MHDKWKTAFNGEKKGTQIERQVSKISSFSIFRNVCSWSCQLVNADRTKQLNTNNKHVRNVMS